MAEKPLIKAKIRTGEDSYIAKVEEYELSVEGKTLPELKTNMKEELRAYLNGINKSIEDYEIMYFLV